VNEELQRLQDEAKDALRERRNWGRWGADDQLGAMNLITDDKRRAAAALVRTGRIVSLSRPFPKTPAANNPNPAQHWMRVRSGPTGGGATDYYAISYHGTAATHLDSLCHMWGPDGLWNGRGPEEVTSQGANWGGIENWSMGIVTRGVLLDVPKFRGEPYVTLDKPVSGPELVKIAEVQGVTVEPGDAVCVHSGREAFERADGVWGATGADRAGLHASCLVTLRDWDVSLLVWDMTDMMRPGHNELREMVHGMLHAFGVGLLDEAMLETLAQACSEENRYEFMIMVAPLVVQGGTGSPVNPLALF
jgi:hypothetical protein